MYASSGYNRFLCAVSFGNVVNRSFNGSGAAMIDLMTDVVIPAASGLGLLLGVMLIYWVSRNG